MLPREHFEKLEAERLAPYALRSAASKGRRHPEEEHRFRMAFQRDRDRVIHSTAFRRLVRERAGPRECGSLSWRCEVPHDIVFKTYGK